MTVYYNTIKWRYMVHYSICQFRTFCRSCGSLSLYNKLLYTINATNRLLTGMQLYTNPTGHFCGKHKGQRGYQSRHNDICTDLGSIIHNIQRARPITSHDQTTLFCARYRNMVIPHGSPIFQMDADCPNTLWTLLAITKEVGRTGRYTVITRCKTLYLRDDFDPRVFG